MEGPSVALGWDMAGQRAQELWGCWDLPGPAALGLEQERRKGRVAKEKARFWSGRWVALTSGEDGGAPVSELLTQTPAC